MTVRPAVAADLEAIRALDAATFGPDAWGEVAWRDQVPETRQILVAVEDEQVVGFAVLCVAADVADLHRIVVESARRRRGIGGALVGVLVAEARARDCDRMLLEVETDDAAALAVYGRRGFVEIARRVAYYGPGRDALVLERELG